MKRVGIFALGLCLMFCLTACGVQITGILLPESVELEVGANEVLAVEYAAGEDTAEDTLAEAASKLALVWTSSDEAVATVDGAGTVTAEGAGEAEITVSSEDGKLQASCIVTVTVAPTGIDAPEALELEIGGEETKALGASLFPEDATGELTYESSDEAVATVDADGTVSAVAPGECVIKIKAAGIASPAAEAETKVTVTGAKEDAENDNANGADTANNGKKGTTSNGDATVSGDKNNTGSNGTTGGTNIGSVGGTTTPTQPSNPAPAPQPDPTPVPAPDPTPAPAPDPGPVAPPPTDGGGIGGNINDVIPGGGDFESDMGTGGTIIDR